MNNLNKDFLLIGLAVLPFVVTAKTVTWKADGAAGLVDNATWTEAANFVEGEAPEDGDTVVIPANKTVTVDDDSADIVSRLERVHPEDATSHMIITINIDTPFVFGCGFGCETASANEAVRKRGRFFKRGTGEMVLGKAGSYANYSSFVVEEGTLRLPRTGYVNYHDLAVSNNATLYAAEDGYTYCDHCFIDGRLTNEKGKQFRPQARDVWSVISETATVDGGIQLYANGNLRILSTNNVMTGRTCGYYGGVLEVMSFGDRSKPSSIGTCAEFGGAEGRSTGEHTAYYRYLGTGETVNHNPWHGYPAQGPLVFDAGATGGLNFANTCTWGGSDGNVGCYILTGDSVKTNVIDGKIHGTGILRTFVKRGSGTWQFARNTSGQNRAGIASVAVEEGTLQFYDLQDGGTDCTLGPATNCLEVGYWGTKSASASHVTDYSLALGSTNGNLAVFESVGTDGIFCKGRRMALRGDITLRNSSQSADGKTHSLKLEDFRSIAAKPLVVTLDGTGEDNEIVNVNEAGAGAVSVVKKGEGNWTLAGTNTVSGSVRCEAGALTVKAKDAPYDWFRWRVKSIGSSGAGSYLCVAEFGIYDADGHRLNTGMGEYTVDDVNPAVSRSFRTVMDLEPGTYGFWCGNCKETQNKATAVAYRLVSLFDDTTMRFDCSKGYGSWTAVAPDPEDESTWIDIVMRLPANSKPAASYDIVAGITGEVGRLPKSWVLEGSSDGYSWTVLDEHTVPDGDFDTFAAGAWKWMSKKVMYSNGSAATHTGGWAIAGAPANDVTTVFASVGTDAGATLTARGTVSADGLVLDATRGGGTIRGVQFAPTGTISVSGLRRGQAISIPVRLQDEAGEALAVDLSDWTVQSDGQTFSGYTAAQTPEGIRLLPPGAMIIIR